MTHSPPLPPSQALVYQGGLLSQTKPKLYSQCMCLLYRLASSEPSAGPMLDHLSPQSTALVPGLSTILVSPVPEQDRVHELSAALHQRSWVLRLQV